MNKYVYSAAILIGVACGFFVIGRATAKKEPPRERIITRTVHDTIITNQTVTKEKLIPVYRTVRETLYVNNEPVINETFVAEVDSVIITPDLRAELKFVSPIPLSVRSFFDVRFDIAEKVIKETQYIDRIVNVEVPRQKGFFDYVSLGVYIGKGVSYHQASDRWSSLDWQVGAGIIVKPF